MPKKQLFALKPQMTVIGDLPPGGGNPVERSGRIEPAGRRCWRLEPAWPKSGNLCIRPTLSLRNPKALPAGCVEITVRVSAGANRSTFSPTNGVKLRSSER